MESSVLCTLQLSSIVQGEKIFQAQLTILQFVSAWIQSEHPCQPKHEFQRCQVLVALSLDLSSPKRGWNIIVESIKINPKLLRNWFCKKLFTERSNTFRWYINFYQWFWNLKATNIQGVHRDHEVVNLRPHVTSLKYSSHYRFSCKSFSITGWSQYI